MAVEAQQLRYKALTDGLDRILQAADPVNQAQRQMALMNLAYEQKAMPLKEQELQYNLQMLKAKADWMRDNPGKPYPGSWPELLAMQKFNRMQVDDSNAKAATTDPGTGNVPPGKTTPSYFPPLLPTPQRQIFEQPPASSNLPPTEEQRKRFGPLPGFEDTGTAATDTGAGTTTAATDTGAGATIAQTDTDTDII